MTIIISDLHGCWFSTVRLLNTCAAQYPGARLVLLGDLVDRGPHSRAVVEFAMGHQIPTVLGNHESLCLAYSAHARQGYDARCASYYERDIWLYNGGEETLANWLPDESQWREGLPKDVLDWMAALPPYIILDEVDEQGRKLLCSHTGYGLDADSGGWFRALWGRHEYGDGEFPEDNLYRAFGHTQKREAEVTDKWAMIDSGAAYAKRGLGTLTAFIWPTKALIQQRFDETPIQPQFSIVGGCIEKASF
jgi:hypothetical protein